MTTRQDLVLPQQLTQIQQTNTYGKFVTEPFESGYGHTVGNALRRILLSSLDGAAITSCKIKGASHEFDIIKNLKEDVIHILLNLKKIRLKMFTQGPEKISVSFKGGKTVYAKDFQANTNIEILTPDQVIATIEPGGVFEAEMEVEQGRGYVSAEEHNKTGKPVDTIYIDSLFSPITKVNYEVENTRVGQKTDYDKLIIEIWSDGSILPSDALAYSAKIMRDSVNVFISEEEKTEQIGSAIGVLKEEKMKEFLQQPIEILGLSSRPFNCLSAANIKLISDLVKKKEEELNAIESMGKKSIEEIKEKLTEHNLKLGL